MNEKLNLKELFNNVTKRIAYNIREHDGGELPGEIKAVWNSKNEAVLEKYMFRISLQEAQEASDRFDYAATFEVTLNGWCGYHSFALQELVKQLNAETDMNGQYYLYRNSDQNDFRAGYNLIGSAARGEVDADFIQRMGTPLAGLDKIVNALLPMLVQVPKHGDDAEIDWDDPSDDDGAESGAEDSCGGFASQPPFNHTFGRHSAFEDEAGTDEEDCASPFKRGYGCRPAFEDDDVTDEDEDEDDGDAFPYANRRRMHPHPRRMRARESRLDAMREILDAFERGFERGFKAGLDHF